MLGAAMFMIEIAGVRVLYTGDYSREEDRHLMAAEIPALTPDVLIIVSFGDDDFFVCPGSSFNPKHPKSEK